jgi:hypothetical protein
MPERHPENPSADPPEQRAEDPDHAVPRRRWPLVVSGLAGLIAAPFGYGAGVRISGPGMGWVMAINSAVFGALVVGGVIDRVLRLMQRQNDRR